MIEELPIDWNILAPILITILGFISYFFGKIISETLPGVEERSQNYIFGFLFTLIYLILPLTIIYTFREHLLIKLSIWWGILFFVLLSFIIKYFSMKKNVYQVTKGQAYEDFEKEALKRTRSVLFGLNLKSDEGFIVNMFRAVFTKLPSKTSLFVLTFIEIFLITNLIYSFNIILGVFFLILLISNMGDIAILSVARGINYNEVVIEDKDGKKYDGRIIKYGKEFISIRNKRKVYNFSRENVKYVLTLEKLSFQEDKKENEEEKGE